MRKYLGVSVAIVALVGSVVVAGTVSAEPRGTGGTPFRLLMTGSEEVNAQGVPINPHGDDDRGEVVLTLNQGQERICWQFGALTLTTGEALPHVAHIHQAPSGTAGPVVVDLFGTGASPPAPAAYPTDTVCVAADRALVKEIRQHPEQYYVNLHNATHPAGAVRAQLG